MLGGQEISRRVYLIGFFPVYWAVYKPIRKTALALIYTFWGGRYYRISFLVAFQKGLSGAALAAMIGPGRLRFGCVRRGISGANYEVLGAKEAVQGDQFCCA